MRSAASFRAWSSRRLTRLEVASVLSAATARGLAVVRSRRWHEDRLGFAAGAVRRRALDRPYRGDRRPRARGPRVRRPRWNVARQPAGDARLGSRLPAAPHARSATGRRRDHRRRGRHRRQRAAAHALRHASGPGDRRELRPLGWNRRAERRQGREERRRLRCRQAAGGIAGDACGDHRGGLPPPSAAGGVANRRPRVAVRARPLRVRRRESDGSR